MSNRWSLLNAWLTKSQSGFNIQGNAIRANALPRRRTTRSIPRWPAGLHASERQTERHVNSPVYITFSPLMRYQQGVPFGRPSRLRLGSTRSPSRWTRGVRTPS
jgi:hypothetical protein